MERLRHFLFVRHAHNWRLLFRFAVVGLSGVFVNLLVTIICNKVGPDEDDIFLGLPLTDYNVRWYHVFSTLAFLVANLWNFQLNRMWTFRSAKHSGWLREYLPFLTVGLLAQMVGLGILTLLMHPMSPLALSAGHLRRLHRIPDPAVLGPADHDRRRHPDLVRAEQDLDLLRGPGQVQRGRHRQGRTGPRAR